MNRNQGSSIIQDSHLADGQAVILPIQPTCVTFNFCNCSSVEAVGDMCWWCAVRCSAGVLLTSDTCVFVCTSAFEAKNSRALRSAAGLRTGQWPDSQGEGADVKDINSLAKAFTGCLRNERWKAKTLSVPFLSFQWPSFTELSVCSKLLGRII